MKKILSIIITLVMLAQTVSAVCAGESVETSNLTAANVTEIHVSPLGSDSNEGTKESPVASVEKAVKLVRTLRAQSNNAIDVIFHEGTYRLERSISMDSRDSGSAGAPVTYKAAEGEKVVFKGSKVLDTSKFRPVTDESILERLPENSRNYVGVLDLRGQGITALNAVAYGRAGNTEAVGYHQLYLDNTPQVLSRFPNNYFTKIEAITNASTNTFRMKESNITRWGKAKDARIGGYLLNDYRYEREKALDIDPEARTMRISSTSYKIAGADRRYFVYNLIEELDMPGEWYIDPETYLLYYYPQHSLSDEVLELSTLNKPMFILNGVSHVNFEGIEITQTTNDVFQLPGCTDISFDGMFIHDVQTFGIRDYVEVYRDYQKSPNTYRIIIKNSVFRNIGRATISLRSGDETTLENSGCIIENCYFTGASTEIRSYEPFVNINGVGTVIKNCTMHNAPVHMIQGSGSLHKIINNEFYYCCMESHDVAVLYMGRNHYQRGVEVANNYFHQVKGLDETIGTIAAGVYMDDNLSQWYVHHNIFDGVARAIFSGGGSDSRFHHNIIIDSEQGIRAHPEGSGWHYDWEFRNHSWAYVTQDAKRMMADYPVYLETFPEMAEMYPEDVSLWSPHNNVTTHNLFVNAPNDTKARLGELPRYNVSENNVEVESFDDFVDPENGIYDIKEDAEILKEHPGLGEIKTSEMGCSEDMIKKAEALVNNDIIKTFPRNGAVNVNAAKVEFSWTKNGVYDKYRIKIAKDPDMTDIVIDEEVPYNYYSTADLDADVSQYYWNVEGVDLSQYKKENKKSYGDVYTFTTSKFENTDKLLLNNAVLEAEAFDKEVLVGDLGGQCSQEAKTEYQNAIIAAKNIASSKYSSQEDVDAAVKSLTEAKRVLMSKRNVMYISIEEYLKDGSGWAYDGEQTTVTDSALHLEGSEYTYYEAKYLEGYQLLKFKMKADFAGEWTGFGLRELSPGLTYAVGGHGYMLIVKEDKIEFQRYNNGGGMIKEIPNNGIIKNNEWHEYEVGALDTIDGIRIILRVDGQTVLNEVDTSGVISKNGHFKIFNRMWQRTDVNVDLAPSDEELGEVDQSIISGKLSAVTPEIKGYDELFGDDNAIKVKDAEYKKSEDGIEFKSVAGAQYGGTLSSYGTSKGNRIFKTNIKFNFGDSWQGIGLRADSYDGIPWKLSNYMIVVKKDVIELQRFAAFGGTYLAIVKNEFIKDGEFTELTYGAYPTDKGMRILVYAGDNKIIDYTDPYSKHQEICVNFYDRNGMGMEIAK